MSKEQLVLVDENDQKVGLMEKMEVHQKGLLHRAFSVFVLNDKNQLMLQRRADTKYHSRGLWTNTCCSHPRECETPVQGGERRLMEEMGFTVPLKSLFSFVYSSPLDTGLYENEYDYVLLGYYNESPVLNSKEASDWRWVDLVDLLKDLQQNSDQYTVWLKKSFQLFYDYVR